MKVNSMAYDNFYDPCCWTRICQELVSNPIIVSTGGKKDMNTTKSDMFCSLWFELKCLYVCEWDSLIVFSIFRQEPAAPPPIVINKYSDERLRSIIKQVKERLDLYKEKVVDQYASSPEVSPPVSEYTPRVIHQRILSAHCKKAYHLWQNDYRCCRCFTEERSSLSAPLLPKDVYAKVTEERKRLAEEERIKKEEADKKKKEEQEKKKQEAEQKKKEEEEKKKAEGIVEKKEEKSLKVKLSEAVWFSVDLVLKPVEDMMDSVLGNTMDPFTDRRYITWLSVVTLAFNYNTWFMTARLCFPYHTERAIPYWFAMDLFADFIYLTDAIIFQPRKQFVKAGDIIVSFRAVYWHTMLRYWSHHSIDDQNSEIDYLVEPHLHQAGNQT